MQPGGNNNGDGADEASSAVSLVSSFVMIAIVLISVMF